MWRVWRNDHHISRADAVRLASANPLAALWRSSCRSGGGSTRSDERRRAAHDDHHGRPILMGMQFAFIRFAAAVGVSGPGAALPILAREQVLAAARGESLRKRHVYLLMTEVRDQRSRRLLLRVGFGQPSCAKHHHSQG